MAEGSSNSNLGEETGSLQSFGLQPTNLILNTDGDLVEAGKNRTSNLNNDNSVDQVDQTE
jgi:hypothetical protein